MILSSLRQTANIAIITRNHDKIVIQITKKLDITEKS